MGYLTSGRGSGSVAAARKGLAPKYRLPHHNHHLELSSVDERPLLLNRLLESSSGGLRKINSSEAPHEATLITDPPSLLLLNMASGYGLYGGQSRCFPFWQELLACYVVNTTADDISGGKKCLPALADYEECLNHKKEAARIARLQRAYRRAQAAHPREDMPSADALRNLGLLNKAAETEKVLASAASARARGEESASRKK